MTFLTRVISATLFLMIFCAPCAAQPVLSEQAQISVITVQPGDPVYTLFGHTAVRLWDPVLEIDYSYNYGTFDFEDPLFVPKFVQGNLNYFLSIAPYQAAVRHYSEVENRTVIEQILDLSPGQRQAVSDFLFHNAQPENRAYRYDFLYDNCSTRVLDMLAHVLNLDIPTGPTGLTFRQMLNPYLKTRPLMKTGIDMSLGNEVDEGVSMRESSFLPDELMLLLDRVDFAEEQRGSLVARTDTVASVPPLSKPFAWPAMVGWILVVGQVLRTFLRGRGSMVVDVTAFAIAGLAGILFTYMWFFTRHTVTAWNINLLWALPTHLVFAILFARSALSPRLTRLYGSFAIGAGLLYLLSIVSGAYVSPLVVPWAVLLIVSAARFVVRSKQAALTEAAE